MGRPPLIRAMPERKRFFSIDLFPYVQCYVNIYEPGWGAQAKSETERLLHGWCRSRSGSECQDDHRHSHHIQDDHHHSNLS